MPTVERAPPAWRVRRLDQAFATQAPVSRRIAGHCLSFRLFNHLSRERISVMLRLALFFLVVSLVAAVFGFGGIAAAAADIARILFFVAIVIFLVLLVAGLMAGSTLF